MYSRRTSSSSPCCQKKGKIGEKSGKSGEKAGIQVQEFFRHRVEIVIEHFRGLTVLRFMEQGKGAGEETAVQQLPALVQRPGGESPVCRVCKEIKGLHQSQQQEQKTSASEYAAAVPGYGTGHGPGQQTGIVQAYGNGQKPAQPGGDTGPAQDGGKFPGGGGCIFQVGILFRYIFLRWKYSICVKQNVQHTF